MAIEIGVAFVIGIRGSRNLLLILLVNIATNLSINLLLIILRVEGIIDTGLPLTYGVLEPLVVLVEGLIYKVYLEDRRNPFLLSLILNLSSIIIGGLIWKSVF